MPECTSMSKNAIVGIVYHVVINDMVDRSRTGRVILRPVSLSHLSALVTDRRHEQERRAFAGELAFGPDSGMN